MVGEPSEAEALEILEGLRERYERHHRCVYAPEALAAAVHLSARYIPDRRLPDKVHPGWGLGCSSSRLLRLGRRARALPPLPAQAAPRPPLLAVWPPLCHPSCPACMPHLHPTPPCQAIDLLDEAGSRVRIATYLARKEAGGREGLEAANTRWAGGPCEGGHEEGVGGGGWAWGLGCWPTAVV